MITNKDIDKLKDTFSTKDELTQKLIEFKDAILSEIIKLREDVMITTGYRELIEDHEVRITKLESKKTLPS